MDCSLIYHLTSSNKTKPENSCARYFVTAFTPNHPAAGNPNITWYKDAFNPNHPAAGNPNITWYKDAFNPNHPAAGNPNITWYKDGERLADDARAVTSSDDSHVTLTIESADERDVGKYTCQLKNAAGTSKSTAELLVRST